MASFVPDPPLNIAPLQGQSYSFSNDWAVWFRSLKTTAGAAGPGTVTSFSFTAANGVSGVVANPTTTPALTITLGNITPTSVAAVGTVAGSNLSGTNTGDQTFSITGDVTAVGSIGILTATVTKINGVALSGLGTGILKNTTATGVPSIAVAADFPTLNQNTTGSAAKWTTARTIAGNSVDGSANVPFANKFIVQGTADAGLSAAQFLGALGTGIVKNTTTTGVLSIAVAGDFPTLNQSTTGSAATLTTSRLIYGNGFNGSADVTGIIASNFGGTGNGFTKFSGPATAEKTKTLRDANDTILELGGTYTPTGGWTFQGTMTLDSTSPLWIYNENDQGVDLKNWLLGVNNGLMQIQTRTDAGVTILQTFAADRSGNTKHAGRVFDSQGAPASKAAGSTLTAAEVLGGMAQYTGAAGTLTLPTGTAMDSGVNTTLVSADQGCWFSVINTGSGTATVTAGVTFTIVGGATVAAAASGLFRCRRTAANTWIAYRSS